MTWSLATYAADGAAALGVLREDGTLVTPADLKRWATAMELLADWPAAEPVLRDLCLRDAPPVHYDKLLAPLRWPRKVICAGVNYRRHMREMGGEIPADGWRPFFFLKAPTTSVIGPHDPDCHQGPGPRPVRLGGRTGRRHRYRRERHRYRTGRGSRGRLLRGQRRDRARLPPA